MVMDAFLPGVAPTGRKVEIVVVVIVGTEGGKVAFERIYWDQASVLVQLGLLDPRHLPVTGVEQARKVMDPTLPANRPLRRCLSPQPAVSHAGSNQRSASPS